MAPFPLVFNNDSVIGYVDYSSELDFLSDYTVFTGWICAKEKISSIVIEVEQYIFPAQYGLPRPDVATYFSRKKPNSDETNKYLNVGLSGFSISFNCLDEINSLMLKNALKTASVKVELESGETFISQKFAVLLLNPKLFLKEDVPLAQSIKHPDWINYLKDLCDKPNFNILEVGSRKVTGINLGSYFEKAAYTGFDIYDGEYVDVVGDAHCLSNYFNEQKFDLIVSNAVFEHLAMPWVVALEMIKLLKVGGYIFVETHYSFGSHERPWHFFQFSEKALEILFPRVFGIACIESGVSNPIIGFFSPLASSYLQRKPIRGLYCHSSFLGKKVEEIEDLKWNKVEINELLNYTCYPPPDKNKELL